MLSVQCMLFSGDRNFVGQPSPTTLFTMKINPEKSDFKSPSEARRVLRTKRTNHHQIEISDCNLKKINRPIIFEIQVSTF